MNNMNEETNMNTVEEIEEALNDLRGKMGDKGVVTPEALFSIRTEGKSYVHISANYKTAPFDGSGSKVFMGGDIINCFGEANSYIDRLPSPEDQVTNEYLTKVAAAVDYATEHSIADEYVAPLRGVTCAMTDNLLTCDGD